MGHTIIVKQLLLQLYTTTITTTTTTIVVKVCGWGQFMVLGATPMRAKPKNFTRCKTQKNLPFYHIGLSASSSDVKFASYILSPHWHACSILQAGNVRTSGKYGGGGGQIRKLQATNTRVALAEIQRKWNDVSIGRSGCLVANGGIWCRPWRNGHKTYKEQPFHTMPYHTIPYHTIP